MPQNATPKGVTALPNAGATPKGEATDLIGFVFAVIFFLHFPPRNRVSSPKTA
jgi:hypothetical protein